MTATRERAAQVAEEVTRRLADPAAVERAAAANTDQLADGRRPLVWHPMSLNEGYLGIALLHSERGDRDRAHAFLSAAATRSTATGSASRRVTSSATCAARSRVAVIARGSVQALRDRARHGRWRRRCPRTASTPRSAGCDACGAARPGVSGGAET